MYRVDICSCMASLNATRMSLFQLGSLLNIASCNVIFINTQHILFRNSKVAVEVYQICDATCCANISCIVGIFQVFH